MTFERPGGWSRTPALDRTPLGLLAALLLLFVLVMAPALARAQGADSLTLRWTAPGDDGLSGRVTSYEVHMATFAINGSNVFNAPILADPPLPLFAGATQSMVVRGLSRDTTYWFAVRSVDDVGNWSPISNVLRWTWPADAAPPAAPSGVNATVLSDSGHVELTWSPNGEPDLAGYGVYRATVSTGPWLRLDPQPVTTESYRDPSPPAIDRVWYAITAIDRAGNESAKSAPIKVLLGGASNSAPVAWRLRPAFPNPARLGETMHVPVDVPVTSQDARIDILDDAGQLVRRIEVRSAGVTTFDAVWDGRNDGGRLCAPGVYRLWLVAGDHHEVIRVARVP